MAEQIWGESVERRGHEVNPVGFRLKQYGATEMC